MIVGSSTTGYTRVGSVSQARSAVTVTVVVAPCCSSRWVTLSLHAFPYGEFSSSRSSYMNGAGMTNTGSPPERRTKAIDPSDPCSATRPPVRTVNEYDASPAGAARSTMLSFNAPADTSYTRSAPPASPGYVTVDPATRGGTPLAGPARPSSTCRPSCSNRTNRAEDVPNRLVNAFVTFPAAKPGRPAAVRTCVSIGWYWPRPSR